MRLAAVRAREPYRSLEDRLLMLSYQDHNGCWIWLGKTNWCGYGHISFKSPAGHAINRRAHRVAYEVFRGETIPDGMTLDHSCGEARCINPDHLRPVTMAENLRLRDKRRRTTKEQTRDVAQK